MGTARRPYHMNEVREAGFEPTTFGSGGRRSIQLSYSRAPAQGSREGKD